MRPIGKWTRFRAPFQEKDMSDRSRSKVSRRRFGASTMGAAVGAGALTSAHPQSPGSSPMNSIDQNPIRRRGVGLRGIDRARACPGLTLFAPAGLTEVFLVDLDGTVVHSWKMPHRPGLYGYLTDRGTLFYNGQVPNETFLGKQPYMGGSVMEMDWNGKILWE